MRAIDGDALYNEMTKRKAFGELTAKSALRAVLNAPTIEPERKKGEWFGTVCSACGADVPEYFDCDYCPKCGADMRG